MKDVDDKDARGVFIKLSEEEFVRLKAIAKKTPLQPYYDARDVSDMHKCLEYFGQNVQSLVGDVGAPSKVLDAFD